jgi:hypothetical protein
MWLELSDAVTQTRFAIHRAISDDGVRFRIDPAAPVIDDGDVARAPSAVRDGDDILLYWQRGDGEAIVGARSPDGVTFEAPVEVLAGGAGAAAVRAPGAVLLPDGSLALYHERGGGAGIALAVGPPLGPLAGRGTVLTPADVEDPPGAGTTQFWVEIDALHSPSAVLAETVAGPVVRLYFTAFGRESADSVQFGVVEPIPPNFSVGYGVVDPAAPGSVVLWPYNPVFDRVSAFLDHHGELGPSAVQVTDAGGVPLDQHLLYFVDGEGDGSSTTGLSVVGNGAAGPAE